MKRKSCIVLLSGGQDSTTCLYWAKQNFEEVVAIGFDYGQTHRQELFQAKKIAQDANVEYIIFPAVGLLGGSSLTNHDLNHNSEHKDADGLPASFTAGRNALFLTVAASYGHRRGIAEIVTGVCQTDYSGYPDCRLTFIVSMKMALSFGIYGKGDLLEIHTPLMHLTKAETWKLAKELGCFDVIVNDTMTDYNGSTERNDWGYGREDNPASKLRANGYREAKEKGWI
jgi:7-cyano-7-deazaguanine synthase